MENKIIELLSEEIRETKNLTIAVKNEAIEVKKLADAAMKRADASWELVVMTRNEINRPLWRKWFGLS